MPRRGLNKLLVLIDWPVKQGPDPDFLGSVLIWVESPKFVLPAIRITLIKHSL